MTLKKIEVGKTYRRGASCVTARKVVDIGVGVPCHWAGAATPTDCIVVTFTEWREYINGRKSEEKESDLCLQSFRAWARGAVAAEK